MIDNYNQLEKWMDFSDPDAYYFIQILKRRKDNPDMPRDMTVVGEYCIRSRKQYLEMEEEIKATARAHNARVYLKVARRSMKNTAYLMNERLGEYLRSGQHSFVASLFAKIAGNTDSRMEKIWVVDIDDKNRSIMLEAANTILALYRTAGKPDRNPWLNVETVNGFHILCTPFNYKLFKERHPDIDVHKDNFTLLYAP